MISYDAGRLSLRRILGYLPTGLAWATTASYALNPVTPAGWVATLEQSLGAVGVSVALVLMLFCVGAAMAPVNFSFAVGVGSAFDGLTKLTWNVLPPGARQWLEANEIVSPMSLGERRARMRAWLNEQGAPRDLGPVSVGNVEWRILKLLVMNRSAVFATEIIDLEAEANLYAGLAMPLCVLGVLLFRATPWLGCVLVLLGLVAPIRFQYARHRELDEIANAYVAVHAESRSEDGGVSQPTEPMK